ncbi:MAG TPA: site-2 protease family protein [Solirubrobacteraceae bacterium]|jgi:regulator of sigma E protease
MGWVPAALAAFLGFSALIMLHELGHFAAAKAVGMRVEKFSLFFGPMLVKVRRGETVYGVAPIPLGGYVKITGMNPYEKLPPDVAPRAYFRQPVWKRLVVIGAGPAMSLLVAFALLWGIFTIHGTFHATGTVEQVARDAPATGKLRPGDRIVAVDGRRGDFEALRDQVNRHRCAGRQTRLCEAATPARLTVERDGRTITLLLRPRYQPSADRMLLGFTSHQRLEREGPVAGAGLAVSTMWDVTTQTVSTIGRLLFSSQARKQTSGVVGAYEVTRQSFEFSITQALFLLGVISLSLGVINLFPFLPLDGGHIFFALAEKVRGRAIPFSVMERASVVGIMLVLFMFVIGFTNDIGRLTGEGFGVR